MDSGFPEPTNHTEKDPLSTTTPVNRAFMDPEASLQQQQKRQYIS